MRKFQCKMVLRRVQWVEMLLQYIVVCCSVVQCGAVCCNV